MKRNEIIFSILIFIAILLIIITISGRIQKTETIIHYIQPEVIKEIEDSKFIKITIDILKGDEEVEQNT